MAVDGFKVEIYHYPHTSVNGPSLHNLMPNFLINLRYYNAIIVSKKPYNIT